MGIYKPLILAAATIFLTASGLAGDEISTCSELASLSDEEDFDEPPTHKLVNDIDCTGQSFSPLGGDTFTDSFDGQNHTIEGLTISDSGSDNVGLFRQLENWDVGSDRPQIKNIHFKDADIEGDRYVGVLVGGGSFGYADIKNIKIEDSEIEGNSEVGALAGKLHDSNDRPTPEVSNILVKNTEVTADTRSGMIAGEVQGGGDSNDEEDIIVDNLGVIGGNLNNKDTDDLSGVAALFGRGRDFPVTLLNTFVADLDSDGFESGRDDYIIESLTDVSSSNGYYSSSTSISDTDFASELSDVEMQGEDAEDNMDGFDFESTWAAPSGKFPHLTRYYNEPPVIESQEFSKDEEDIEAGDTIELQATVTDEFDEVVNVEFTVWEGGDRIIDEELGTNTNGDLWESPSFDIDEIETEYEATLSLAEDSEGLTTSASDQGLENPTVEVDNVPPEITGAELKVDDSDGTEQIEISIDDKGLEDVDDWIGEGNEVEFTNDKLVVDVELPFSSNFEVIDDDGAISNIFDVDADVGDSVRTENTGFDHDLNTQEIKSIVDITNDASEPLEYTYIFDEVSGDDSGTVSPGDSVEASTVEQDDFIIDVDETGPEIIQDDEEDSTLDNQFVLNASGLEAENTESITFTDTSLSSVCSNTTSVDVEPGVSTLTEECNVDSDELDAVDVTDQGLSPQADFVNLNNNYLGDLELGLQETEGIVWEGLNTSTASGAPGDCTQNSDFTVDLTAGESKDFDLEFVCDPGTVGSPTQEIIDLGGGDERIWFNSTDAEVNHDEVGQAEVIIPVDKDDLRDPDQRDPDSLEAIVNGVSSEDDDSNLTIEDTGSEFRITVGTDFGSSSLSEGSHEWSTTYTLSEDNGATGGGGVSPPSDDDTGVRFENTFFQVQPGAATEREFTIVNLEEAQENQVTISIPDTPQCNFFEIESSRDSGEFGDEGVFRIGPRESILEGVYRPEFRVDMPDTETIEQDFDGELVCSPGVDTSFGSTTEDLTLNVEPTQGLYSNIIGWIEWVLTEGGITNEIFRFEWPVDDSLTVIQDDELDCTMEDVDCEELEVSTAELLLWAFIFGVGIASVIWYRRSQM